MEWIIENAEWIFDGIGVTVIVAVIGIFFKNKKDSSGQTINSGNNSTNIQGENVNVNIGGKDDA